MNTEGAFESFCAASVLRQRKMGVEVPSKLSRSFAYYQWLEVAERKYLERHTEAQEEGELESKRIRVEDAAPRTSAAVPGNSSPLAAALADQLTSSLAKQARPSTLPASLRHAAREAFPMPSAAADMPAFLALAEASVRLTLWCPGDERLALLAVRMRPSLRTLEEKQIIRMREGCYPGLQLLMDLLSWRIIVHRWDRLQPHMRQVAVEGVLTLCGVLRSPATEELRAAVQKLDVATQNTSAPIEKLNSLVGQVSAAVPFQFDTCRDLVALYPEPCGVICLGNPQPQQPPPLQEKALPAASAPGTTTKPPTSRERTRSTSNREREDSELRLVDLIGHKGRAPLTSAVPSCEASHPVLAVVPRASNGRAPTAMASDNACRPPKRTVNGHLACASRYHNRYADPSKHASAECKYCATCHLMEIVFGGVRRDCAWKHWPTTRKIMFHLKRFPVERKLALKRFGEIERGMQLGPTDEVPL